MPLILEIIRQVIIVEWVKIYIIRYSVKTICNPLIRENLFFFWKYAKKYVFLQAKLDKG